MWHTNIGLLFFSINHLLSFAFTVHVLPHNIFGSAQCANDNYTTYICVNSSCVCTSAFPDKLLTTMIEPFGLMMRSIEVFPWEASRLSIIYSPWEAFSHVCRSSFLHYRWCESDNKNTVMQKRPELFTVPVPQLPALVHEILLKSRSQCWFQCDNEHEGLESPHEPSNIMTQLSKKIPLFLDSHVSVVPVYSLQFLVIPSCHTCFISLIHIF